MDILDEEMTQTSELEEDMAARDGVNHLPATEVSDVLPNNSYLPMVMMEDTIIIVTLSTSPKGWYMWRPKSTM